MEQDKNGQPSTDRPEDGAKRTHRRSATKPRRLLDRCREEADTVSTRIIASKVMEVEGAEFHWWAVGENPSLVTVRSPIFGSLAEFTMIEPEVYARRVAKKLLAQHYERAAELRKTAPKRSASGERESE